MATVASTTPGVLAAHIAASTDTIRVGSGGADAAQRTRTLGIAEQFALLEALHPGRIDLGIGRAPWHGCGPGVGVRSAARIESVESCQWRPDRGDGDARRPALATRARGRCLRAIAGCDVVSDRGPARVGRLQRPARRHARAAVRLRPVTSTPFTPTWRRSSTSTGHRDVTRARRVSISSSASARTPPRPTSRPTGSVSRAGSCASASVPTGATRSCRPMSRSTTPSRLRPAACRTEQLIGSVASRSTSVSATSSGARGPTSS